LAVHKTAQQPRPHHTTTTRIFIGFFKQKKLPKMGKTGSGARADRTSHAATDLRHESRSSQTDRCVCVCMRGTQCACVRACVRVWL